MRHIVKIICILIALLLGIWGTCIISYAEGRDEKEIESIKKLLQIESNDEMVSYVVSDNSSFASAIVRSTDGSSLSFFILEKDSNGWKVSVCNKSGMLREYDPLCPPQLGIGPHGSEEQPQNEIYIMWESTDFVGWDESITIKKAQNGWSIHEYGFYSLENHPYCMFYLFVIDDPIDPEFECLAQCSYCLKNCNFDISISSFNRTEIRDGITAMFDYDAIEAWEARHPELENYKNYYDWAIHH